VRIRKSFLLLAIVLNIAAVSTAAENNSCSTRTTSGRYVVKCDGFLSLGPNSPLLPAKGLAVATADRHGNFNGSGAVSVGGSPGLPQTVTGTEQLNPDCTGTITYHQTISGNPAPDINISFVVFRDGDRISGIVTDAGAVYSCELTRVSR
jgi:hypothetical protein